MKQRRFLRLSVGSVLGTLALWLLLAPSIAQESVPASTQDTTHAAVHAEAHNSAPLATARKVKRQQATKYLAIVDQPTFKEQQKVLADRTLKTLPSQCRTYLKNFYIRYDGSVQRGLGGKTTIMVNGTVSDSEFVGLLVHECGHVTHGNLTGSSQSGASDFADGQDIFYSDAPVVRFFSISWTTERVLRQDAAKEDFVSGYAQSDAFEDFAETFTAYILHRDMLQERAQENSAIAAKLHWMETYFPLAENALATDRYVWNGEIPWDATKLHIQL